MSQPTKTTGVFIPLAQTSRALRERFHIPWNKQRIVWAYVFIAVPFLYFLIVNFGAMLAAFSYSFQEYNTLSSVQKFIGLDNYVSIFTDKDFFQSLRNTLMFAVIRVPVAVAGSLITALLLVNIKRLKGFFRMLFFLPFVTSGVAIAWVFKFMYLPNFGIFTKVFDLLKVPRIDFLGSPQYALYAIAAVTIWASIGFYTLIFLAGLEDIPTEFYEAAEVDGASAWQRFWGITLPLLNRTLVLVVILCLISSLQTFTVVRMMSADNGFGGPLGATRTLPIMIYREAFSSMNMGRAAAISVVFFLIVLAATLIQRRVISSAISE